MDLELTRAQERAAPQRPAVRGGGAPAAEQELERGGGKLDPERGAELRQLAIEAGLAGGELPVEAGGKGWTVFEQVLVHEQYGQVTGGLWSFIPGAYDVLNSRIAGAAEAVPRALPARGAVRRLRRDGARRGLRRPDAGDDRRPRRRRLGPQRREVVRDRAGEHRLHGRPGDGRRW